MKKQLFELFGEEETHRHSKLSSRAPAGLAIERKCYQWIFIVTAD